MNHSDVVIINLISCYKTVSERHRYIPRKTNKLRNNQSPNPLSRLLHGEYYHINKPLDVNIKRKGIYWDTDEKLKRKSTLDVHRSDSNPGTRHILPTANFKYLTVLVITLAVRDTILDIDQTSLMS